MAVTTKGPRVKPWVMPDWMKPYAGLICNTGAADSDRVKVVQSMYNGNADPFINLPLSTLQCAVKSQVIFLYNLKRAGVLPEGQDRLAKLIRWGAALRTVSESAQLVLASKAFPKNLRPGMQALVDECERAFE